MYTLYLGRNPDTPWSEPRQGWSYWWKIAPPKAEMHENDHCLTFCHLLNPTWAFLPKNLPALQEICRKIPRKRAWQHTPLFSPIGLQRIGYDWVTNTLFLASILSSVKLELIRPGSEVFYDKLKEKKLCGRNLQIVRSYTNVNYYYSGEKDGSNLTVQSKSP